MVQIILDEDRGAYEAFIAKLTDALAPKLVAMMKKTPQTVCSQREAYRRYGTGNVRRWVKEGRLKPFAKRPGKIEYKISDLKTLFNQQQDYFSSYVHVQKTLHPQRFLSLIYVFLYSVHGHNWRSNLVVD